LFVEGEEPEEMHRQMAAAVEEAIGQIHTIQKSAREGKDPTRPRWPMIILRSPKGWTGPKFVDGLKIEGTFRAHQVPLLVDAAHPDHVKVLEGSVRANSGAACGRASFRP
jgi:xylulose-5-phosphate/fructose-6-phosphate phosphoketolase